jgi:nitrogen fixation NifU-like protein
MYNDKIMDYFYHPKGAGIIEDASAIGELGNPSCGEVIKFFLRIDENQIITEIKFQAYGSAVIIAAASIITEALTEKSIEEALTFSKDDLNILLEIPPQKMNTANLVIDALHSAILQYKNKNKTSSIQNPGSDEENSSKSNSINENVLDLQGKICPMTFVYTKAQLEEMEAGQVLEVILDYLPAYTNVPESVVRQKLGEILNETDENGIHRIWIRKL